MSGLALTLCGRVIATVDGQSPPGEPLGGKALALLAYLALEPGVHTRDELTALLWGEFPEQQAKASLRQALTHLRHAVGDSLRADRTSVELAGPVECDVLTFLRTVTDDPRAALGVDVSRFLAGLPARHCPAFDEWVETTRATLLRHSEAALAALVREAMARHAWREALDLTARWLAADPLSDAATRAAIEAHYMAGQRGAALATFADYRKRLGAETGAEPSRTLRELVARVEEDGLRRADRPVATEEWYASAPSFDTSLWGRSREWAVLERAWRKTVRGQGHVVLIEGEAGLGKSRLASDFLRWVTSGGGTVLRACGYEASAGVPFGTIVEALGSGIDAPGLGGTDPQWLAEVAHVLPELRRRFPNLPGVSPSASGDRRRLFEGVAQCLLAAAEESPVAVFVDDLQWCDADSCNLLHFLVRRLEQAPVLWCGTLTLGVLARDAPAARLCRALRAGPHSAVVSLAPLTQDDVWEMIHELGRVSAPTGARRLAARIHEVTAGNPFYVIELLKTLFAQGWLTVDPETGEWVVPPSAEGDGHEVALSPTVHDAISERIECLRDDLHATLITIAVSGRGCRAEVISYVQGISRLHAAALSDALLERHLVVEDGGMYRCAHPVIARVVRDSLSTARRREVHRSVALTLELTATPSAEPMELGEIARHAEAAGERATAYKYALMASRASVTRYAYDEALAWLDLAAEMASTPEESKVVDRVTAELLDNVGGRDASPPLKGPTRALGQLERADLDLPART